MFDPIYIRDPEDRWIRATVEDDAVVVALQERVVQQAGMIVGLGPHDEEIWRRTPFEAPQQRQWIECARVAIDERWAALGASGLEWPQVLHGIQRHLTALIAGGWGNPIGELVACFADPTEEQMFICDQVYEVVQDYGPLAGFVGSYGAFQEVMNEEEESTLELRFLQMPKTPIPVAGMAWVRALLIATHPLVGCRLPSRAIENE